MKTLSVVCLGSLLLGCERRPSPAAGDEPRQSSREESAMVSFPLRPRAEREGLGRTLFAEVPPEKSGISPDCKPDPTHRYASLEGSGMEASGIAVGDIDGDGLPDVFLASSPGNNRLYRQTAPFRFEDITSGSGLDEDRSWTRGVSMVDIDNDGDLDIFAANYGEANCLYLNEGSDASGKVRFVERAEAVGLARTDASLMPAFCDYDQDGDLDMYLVSNLFHLPEGAPVPDLRQMIGRKNGEPVINPPYDRFFRVSSYKILPTGGVDVKWGRTGRPDVLYRNNGDGTFSDATVEAGMVPGHGRGLSATWWDYDDDGRMDLYVASDWGDRDYLYHNNGDGTFRDVIEETVPYTSMFSMGADTGDLNNDGRLDLMVADMSGTTHYKRKISMGAMQADASDLLDARLPQNMRNAVFLATGTPRVLEGAYLMGLANSDWSWAVKIDDLDNDGRVDVFVTNGMEQNIRESEAGTPVSPAELRNENNLAFRNEGDFRFREIGAAWGLDHFGFSLAAASCDFDRDGDIDLLVVNRDEPPSLYENNATGESVLIELRGRSVNRHGLGARIRIETASGVQTRQVKSARGYLGSDEAIAHFGLGSETKIDRLVVDWPGGHRQEFNDLVSGRLYRITESNAEGVSNEPAPEMLFAASDALSDVRHRERRFDDFAVQLLLPNRLSQLGPGIAVGDIDGDGDDDLVFGGAFGAATQIVLNKGDGTYDSPREIPGSELFEDMGLLLVDVDSDGDRDLFAVSGGVESTADGLCDRLYVNDGAGNFTRAPDSVLGSDTTSGGPVAAADIDRDGDLDLFVGGRVIPGEYPRPASSRLLVNGGGKLVDVTQEKAGMLENLGLVTGAVFADIDGDGWQDLLISREWGPITFLWNEGGSFSDGTAASGLGAHTGWWNGIDADDIDGDGDMDLVATNFGLSTKYHASEEHPALIYYGSFGTDKMHVVEAEFEGQVLFPVRGKSCSTQAMPHLAKKFDTFHAFALAELDEVYEPNVLAEALKLSATTLESGIFLNNGAGGFEFHPLPRVAQIAPGFGVIASELDGDGIPDLFVAQNFYTPQPETGRMSGGLGLLLRGLGDGKFEPLWPGESGIAVPEDAKGAVLTDLDGDTWPDLLVASNHGPVRAFMNRAENSAPAGTRMLRVCLRGKGGNTDAIGARLTAEFADGTRRVSEVRAGSGYLSQSSPALHIATAGRELQALVVRWPDGQVTRHDAGKEGSLTLSQP